MGRSGRTRLRDYYVEQARRRAQEADAEAARIARDAAEEARRVEQEAADRVLAEAAAAAQEPARCAAVREIAARLRAECTPRADAPLVCGTPAEWTTPPRYAKGLPLGETCHGLDYSGADHVVDPEPWRVGAACASGLHFAESGRLFDWLASRNDAFVCAVEPPPWACVEHHADKGKSRASELVLGPRLTCARWCELWLAWAEPHLGGIRMVPALTYALARSSAPSVPVVVHGLAWAPERAAVALDAMSDDAQCAVVRECVARGTVRALRCTEFAEHCRDPARRAAIAALPSLWRHPAWAATAARSLFTARELKALLREQPLLIHYASPSQVEEVGLRAVLDAAVRSGVPCYSAIAVFVDGGAEGMALARGEFDAALARGTMAAASPAVAATAAALCALAAVGAWVLGWRALAWVLAALAARQPR
jgi:hypothetical protein